MASMAWRIVVGALILTALQIAGGMLLVSIGLALPQPPSNALAWMALYNLIAVAVLAWMALRSAEEGWRLATTLGAVLFGVTTFNSLIEAQFFGFFGTNVTLSLLATTLLETALFAPLLVVLLRRPRARAATENSYSWRARLTPLRLLTGGIAYVITYFAAGLIVIPYVRDFYATKPMPNGLALIALQVLVRGPVFVALVYMGIRALRVARADAVVIAGALLSVLGGVGLIIPNGFFPDYVRWSHFFEVTISNFVYGAFVGWLLTRSVKAAASHRAAGGHLAEVTR